VNFFVVPDNRYNPEWETVYDAVVVKRETSRSYFITLSQNDNVADELDLEAVKLPEVSLAQLDELITTLRNRIQEEEQRLKALTADLPSLKAAMREIEQRINYKKVRRCGASLADDKLMLLQGWAPEDNLQEISDYLESKTVYFDVADPTPDDDVPIKFKNNRFARLFDLLPSSICFQSITRLILHPISHRSTCSFLDYRSVISGMDCFSL
jgi:V/A-type H+-transporting ATPase subunit I